MADYTALVEAGEAIVDLLRDMLTPEPIADRELIALCSPHESENNQLTLFLYHMEEQNRNGTSGFQQVSRNIQRKAPTQFALHYLVTAHSKAPAQLKAADQQRIIGAVIQVLSDYPAIPARYLGGSLREEGADLHVMVERLQIDELMKIWNDNTKEYKLSFSILVTGVSISSRSERKVARVTDVEIHTDFKDPERSRL